MSRRITPTTIVTWESKVWGTKISGFNCYGSSSKAPLGSLTCITNNLIASYKWLVMNAMYLYHISLSFHPYGTWHPQPCATNHCFTVHTRGPYWWLLNVELITQIPLIEFPNNFFPLLKILNQWNKWTLVEIINYNTVINCNEMVQQILKGLKIQVDLLIVYIHLL
jgi:hypothetical protein